MFVDRSRGKRVSEGSASSENGIDSLFKDSIATYLNAAGDNAKIISGYNPEENKYYITFVPVQGANGFTIGYDATFNMWQSRYTFYPDMYASQDGVMYSATYRDPDGDDNATLFYSHTDADNRNTFYGASAPSIVRVASNYNPSMVKVFNAISIEEMQRWLGR